MNDGYRNASWIGGCSCYVYPTKHYKQIVSAVKALGETTPSVTFSGDEGVVHAWVRDDGLYMGKLWQWHVMISEIKCVTKDGLIVWLRETVPQIKEKL